MVEPEAAQIRLTDTPRISISRLLDLRAFLDSALTSASGDFPLMEVPIMKRSDPAQRDLFAPSPQPMVPTVRAKTLEQLQVLLLEAIATPTSTRSATSDREAQDDEDFA